MKASTASIQAGLEQSLAENAALRSEVAAMRKAAEAGAKPVAVSALPSRSESPPRAAADSRKVVPAQVLPPPDLDPPARAAPSSYTYTV
eukprot:6417547-Prymnesium_polylepis.2